MIGIIRHSLKARLQSCCVPANSLCINVLHILRENGFINGFTFNYSIPSTGKGFYNGYPRVFINFKYADSNSPIIKDLRTYKNTKSNIFSARRKYLVSQYLSDHHFLILNTSNGLKFVSNNEYLARARSSIRRKNQKLLLRINI